MHPAQISIASDPLDEAFERFHKRNPHVYEQFVRLARELKRAGHHTAGARLIGERIRWDRMMATTSEDDYKINDHHWPRYARLAMEREPDLDGFFRLRRIRSDLTTEAVAS